MIHDTIFRVPVLNPVTELSLMTEIYSHGNEKIPMEEIDGFIDEVMDSLLINFDEGVIREEDIKKLTARVKEVFMDDKNMFLDPSVAVRYSNIAKHLEEIVNEINTSILEEYTVIHSGIDNNYIKFLESMTGIKVSDKTLLESTKAIVANRGRKGHLFSEAVPIIYSVSNDLRGVIRESSIDFSGKLLSGLSTIQSIMGDELIPHPAINIPRIGRIVSLGYSMDDIGREVSESFYPLMRLAYGTAMSLMLSESEKDFPPMRIVEDDGKFNEINAKILLLHGDVSMSLVDSVHDTLSKISSDDMLPVTLDTVIKNIMMYVCDGSVEVDSFTDLPLISQNEYIVDAMNELIEQMTDADYTNVWYNENIIRLTVIRKAISFAGYKNMVIRELMIDDRSEFTERFDEIITTDHDTLVKSLVEETSLENAIANIINSIRFSVYYIQREKDLGGN